MTALAARVLATLRRRRLLAHGTRVLAAVSGGADSVALAHLLAELSAAGALQLVAVAHFDHCLRGAESARDASFCRDLAGALDVPFDVEALDVAGEAKRRKTSIESTARDLRYAFLERARALGVEHRPPAPILLGRHLLELGMNPGPRVGEILKAVYEKQMDGSVTTLEQAIGEAKRLL